MAHFLENCASTPACWYRVDSCTFGQMQAVEQGKDPVDSPLPPLSRLMGMETKQSNDLLLACGLSEKCGKETQVSLQGWEDLRSLFQLDIDIEREKSKHIAPGRKVWVVRVGSFTNGVTFDSANFAESILNELAALVRCSKTRWKSRIKTWTGSISGWAGWKIQLW